jgi:xylan 1,4-beta-xylosidase
MQNSSRRNMLKQLLAGAVSAPFATDLAAAAECKDSPAPEWISGVENQRKADLGNGTFLNPIVPGDHPDPTILKDGSDYYMTFSSFNSYPGLVIWHSTDLVNWAPLVAALSKPHLYTRATARRGVVHLCDLGRRYQRSME